MIGEIERVGGRGERPRPSAPTSAPGRGERPRPSAPSDAVGRMLDAGKLYAKLYAGVTRRDFPDERPLGDREIAASARTDLPNREIQKAVSGATFDQIVFLLSMLLMNMSLMATLSLLRQSLDHALADMDTELDGAIHARRVARRTAHTARLKEIGRKVRTDYRAYDEQLKELIAGARRLTAIGQALRDSLAKRIETERREVARVVSRFEKRYQDILADVRNDEGEDCRLKVLS